MSQAVNQTLMRAPTDGRYMGASSLDLDANGLVFDGHSLSRPPTAPGTKLAAPAQRATTSARS